MKIKFITLLLITLPFSLFAQNVYVNQVGYIADQQKLVFFIQIADSFYVVDTTSGQIRFRGKIETSKLNDPATGVNVYYGDFSSFTDPGIYRIKNNIDQISYPFEISSNPFVNVYKKTLKGFYFQRCGTALDTQYAGVYARPTCHINDATFDASTGLSGSRDVMGGWHDAGDYGKYVVNAGISVGTLLMGYELFPDYFKSDDLNIPESGNSVPDILDEVKYELDWLLKMQDSDGSVFFKVTPHNFSGFIMANTDNSIRYIFQKSSTATGDFAAVMSMAARIYMPFDTLFASKCLSAAENAWLYLGANPSIVPTGGFHNPSGTVTGEYGDGNDSDERLWAASELFITTGDSTYGNYFSSQYQNFGLISSTMGWPNVQTIAQLDYLLSNQSKADTAIKTNLRNGLINYCSSLYNIVKNDGFHVSLHTSEYYWGSNSVVLNNAIILIIGYDLSGNINYYNAALDQFNYILGCNGKDISFITGIGSKYPMHPHHRPSASDGIAEPVPGLVAGGPNKGLNDAVLQSMFTSSTPPALCYADNEGSYASNEIAINWNAPLVFVAGYFSGNKYVTSIKEKVGFTPNNIQIEQNYPNPFNPSTIISYSIPKTDNVKLTVFSSLGKKVTELINKYQQAGNYSIRFNPTNLASGIYFYSLEVGNNVKTHKMILLK